MDLTEYPTGILVSVVGAPEGAAAAQGAAASHERPGGSVGAARSGYPAYQADPEQDNTILDATDGGITSADDVISGRVDPQIRHAAARDNRDASRRGDPGRVDRSEQVADRSGRSDKNAEFTEFMISARDPLHRMAFLLCGDRHRAEELTQQTFERCYRHWHKARQGDPLLYARRILANLRIDSWRRTRREVLANTEDLPEAAPERAGTSGSAQSGTGHVEDRDAVVRALLQLPLKQRRIVVMRHLLDLSEHEVAGELRIPLGTVKSTASRGLLQLRAILEASRGGVR